MRCPQCNAVIRIAPLSRASKVQADKITDSNVIEDKANGDKANGDKANGDKAKPEANLFEFTDNKRLNSDLVKPIELNPSETSPTRSEFSLQKRAVHSRTDRILLAKIFAALLCLVATINLVPALYCWMRWVQFGEPVELARWMYLQVFVAALHLIYAVFLLQIPDWSALRTVAIASLVFAFVFGTVSTGLLLGDGQGLIANFLEIPYSLTTRASIWCVAMLCLSTLISYLSGREAENWRRAEQLLREILHSKSSQGTTA